MSSFAIKLSFDGTGLNDCPRFLFCLTSDADCHAIACFHPDVLTELVIMQVSDFLRKFPSSGLPTLSHSRKAFVKRAVVTFRLRQKGPKNNSMGLKPTVSRKQQKSQRFRSIPTAQLVNININYCPLYTEVSKKYMYSYCENYSTISNGKYDNLYLHTHKVSSLYIPTADVSVLLSSV